MCYTHPVIIFFFFFQNIVCSQQIFTLVALMPPVVVAVFTHDVGQLVALTVSVCNVFLFLVFRLYAMNLTKFLNHFNKT